MGENQCSRDKQLHGLLQCSRKWDDAEWSVTVPGSNNSIVIRGLENNVEYQFQVVAIGTVNRQEIVGERSQVNSASSIFIPQPSSCGVSGCLSIICIVLLVMCISHTQVVIMEGI